MAKNLVMDEGRYITVVAPAGGMASGQGYSIGDSLFGVAVKDVAATEKGAIDTKGVYLLDKADADAWDEGDQVFWDDTAKECKAASGAGLKDIGYAVDEGGSSELGAGTGKLAVRLNGIGKLDV